MIPRKKAVAVSLLLVGGSLKCGYGDFGYEVIWKNIRQTMRKVANDPLDQAIFSMLIPLDVDDRDEEFEFRSSVLIRQPLELTATSDTKLTASNHRQDRRSMLPRNFHGIEIMKYLQDASTWACGIIPQFVDELRTSEI